MASMTGGPNALIGFTAASPSAADPKCAATMPDELGGRPARQQSGNQHHVVGELAHCSRKNFSTSRRF